MSQVESDVHGVRTRGDTGPRRGVALSGVETREEGVDLGREGAPGGVDRRAESVVLQCRAVTYRRGRRGSRP